MALECDIRVGLDITGKRLFSSNRSKYLEVSACVDTFRRSILKSPEIMSWQTLSEGSVLILLRTKFKFSLKLKIFVCGGLQMFPSSILFYCSIQF